MASREQDKKNRKVISARGMIDNAPVKGSKGTYLKLPEGLKFFQPEKNRTYQLVFLPWLAGRGNHMPKGEWTTNRFIFTHTQIGPNEETFICSQKTFGKPCAVCEKYGELRRNGRGDDYYTKVLQPLKFKARELFLIHDLNGDPKNLQVWDESCFLFGDYFRERISLRKKYENFADFEEGFNVMIKGKEKKLPNGSCTEYSTIEFEEREAVPEWLQKAAEKFCLDDCVIEMPYDKLKRLVGSAALEEEEEPEETETEEEEEEPEEPEETETEEEEEPAPKLKKPVGKKPVGKPEPEPEEEEEEPEETEPEEEEEEPEEIEDDLDEEEPEEEEEVSPPPRKKPGKK